MTDGRTARAEVTREKLMDAALDVIRDQGYAAVSARSVAAAAEVNQALIFYHFDTVTGLLSHAFLRATSARVDALRPALDRSRSLGDLLQTAMGLHDAEEAEGNLRILAQMMAASQTDEQMAQASGAALQLWVDPVQEAVERVVRDSALSEVLDGEQVTRLLMAAFIGMEVMAPATDRPPREVLAGLQPLASTLDHLNPLARRAVRTALRPAR